MTRLLCLLAAVAGLPAVSEAQAPTFRAAVEAVRVDVSVMRGVTPVSGLTASNFALVDSGVPQAIESVSVDTVPLNIVLALDTSGSLSNDGLSHLVDAARGLIQMLKPEDSAALLAFEEPAHLRVPMTQDRGAVLAGLGQLKADGATALYDAVFLGMQIRPQTTDARSVMLIFSDGRDTASWLSRASIIEATRRSGVIAHVVELRPESWLGNASVAASEALDDIADAAGGRRWSARSSGNLRELFVQVLEELRSRYLLTYYPSGVAREGWHDVKVTVKGARGDVIARPGYFVPAP